MGVKDLWHILTPYADRKPISELRGKTVAIDLAGWVCESLNVVDYFVHPRQHLKNLFFRTCYLLWEEVTPVFVLEGEAPKLKSAVIAKRNDLQFRGVKPKKTKTNRDDRDTNGDKQINNNNNNKGRTRFNHVLKQCENLLKSMGIECVQGPGEAEAYCAYLNKIGVVDGVISQDSDCFAYGAICVYRNFSVSTQGAQAAQGGAIDIYNIMDISQKMDFGQNKVIAMALLCGCDYCPEGVGGIGRDSVLKLFSKYNNQEILERLRSWRHESTKYNALEMRVDDKNICSNCGHLGRTASHTKNGCGVCRSAKGCDDSLWKEQRLSIKAELTLRRKALIDPTFPSEEIIDEFLSEPEARPEKLSLIWKQPNIVKFVKQLGQLLQWTEIYCFQKFLPIVTRWQLCEAMRSKINNEAAGIVPKEIVKKRTLKGCPSLEVIWHDKRGFFNGLIPDEQIQEFDVENPKGIDSLWTTIEPLNLFEVAYPDLVMSFMKSKEKLKRPVKRRKNKCALDNLQDLLDVTSEIADTIKTNTTKKTRQPKKKKENSKSGLQTIEKFLKQSNVEGSNKKIDTPILERGHGKHKFNALQCSTPTLGKNTKIPSDLESDSENAACDFNLSDVVNDIVKNAKKLDFVKKVHEFELLYDSLTKDPNANFVVESNVSISSSDVMLNKRNRSLSENSIRNISCRNQSMSQEEPLLKQQCVSLDDSFDVMVNLGNKRFGGLIGKFKTATNQNQIRTPVERFKTQHNILSPKTEMRNSMLEDSVSEDSKNASFFHCSRAETVAMEKDAFEVLMEQSFGHNNNSESTNSASDEKENDYNNFIALSDSDEGN